jgi:hypothetical protein
MSVPLRSTAEIPSRRATKPYPERDWFRKHSATLAAKIAQRLAKDKAGFTRLLTEGAGKVSGATRTLAVESQLSEEAGKFPRRPEPTPEADSSSDSEPKEVNVRDPLDPKPNFRRHHQRKKITCQRRPPYGPYEPFETKERERASQRGRERTFAQQLESQRKANVFCCATSERMPRMVGLTHEREHSDAVTRARTGPAYGTPGVAEVKANM